MTDDLSALLEESSGQDSWSARMRATLADPSVSQLVINRHDRVFVTTTTGTVKYEGVFPGPSQYVAWLNGLLSLTDVGYTDVAAARTSTIEGSFDAAKTDLHGSIHIVTGEVTRGQPALTVRKQPLDTITLEEMHQRGMLNTEMVLLLQAAVRGRANILLSGGSGAGKTTLARALSHYIDPSHRCVTVEEIDELHLSDRLPNVVSLTTYRSKDADGRTIRETTLDDLVREGLRMRADRIWVGETRGKEAYALVKACNSGHDGSITTLHADDGDAAIEQARTYVMEAGVPERVAELAIARAFHLVVQISKGRMGRRVITEISELGNVVETGGKQRRNVLWEWDPDSEQWLRRGTPENRLLNALARYGVDYASFVGYGQHPGWR